MADAIAAATPPGEPPSQIQSKKPFIAFQPGNVPPSQSLYLQLNDYIEVRSLSNVSGQTVFLNYRYLTPEGDIKEGQLTVTFQTSIQQQVFTIGEGWLISLGFSPNAFGASGSWAHVQVVVGRNLQGGIPLFTQGVIWEGYLYPGSVAGWPNSPVKEATDGSGQLRTVIGTTPAAGADINEMVPSNRRWQLISLSATLQTSVAAANRFAFCLLDDGSNIFYGEGSSFAHVASTLVRYNFAPGQQFFNDTLVDINIPLPAPLSHKAGYRIRTATVGLQAGDQWSAPRYLIYEWAAYDA